MLFTLSLHRVAERMFWPLHSYSNQMGVSLLWLIRINKCRNGLVAYNRSNDRPKCYFNEWLLQPIADDLLCVTYSAGSTPMPRVGWSRPVTGSLIVRWSSDCICALFVGDRCKPTISIGIGAINTLTPYCFGHASIDFDFEIAFDCNIYSTNNAF